MPECVLWWSSVHQTMVNIMMIKMIIKFIKILSKSYEWCCFEHQTCEGWLSNLKKVRSPNKWKVCLFVIFSIYDTTWNLKPVSKEEFQSSAFLGLSVRRFLKYSCWTLRKKLSDGKFPFRPVISKTASAKFKNDLLTYKSWAKIF